MNEYDRSRSPSGWRRLDNLPSVGMNYLYVWYRAMSMQAARVLDAERLHVDRQIDGYQFVHAMRQVLRAAYMIRDALDGDQRQAAEQAITKFEANVPDAKDARDVLDHFDAYAGGIGNLSHPGTRQRQRQPTESAARQFDVFYEIPDVGQYILHFGPMTIDVTTSRDACTTLVDEILDVMGLAAGDDEAALADVGPMSADNPAAVALAFLAGIYENPRTARTVGLLRGVVTPESIERWDDFSEAANVIGGYAPTSRPDRPSDDIVYVKLVPDTGQTRQAKGFVLMTDVLWLTLQRRSDQDNRWLVHAVARFPIARDELPWPARHCPVQT
jgi:hypothetical protein